MAELTQADRLALVVRAEVTRRRADQAKERAALIDRQTRPLMDALERFVKLYGREPDMDAPGDSAAIGGLIAAVGGASISTEMIEAAAEAADESAEAAHQAALAIRALRAAWDGNGGRTPREWVGVDIETFERAIECALKGA